MFKELYYMLKSQPHYNKSIEVEILFGLYHKIESPIDVYTKGTRKIKYKQKDGR